MYKGFKLAAAIVAISIGAIEFAFGVMMITSIFMIRLGLIVVILTAPIIVLGSILLFKQKNRGVTIALLAINSVTLLLGIFLLMSGAIHMIFSLAPHGVLLAFLIVLLVKWDQAATKVEVEAYGEGVEKKIALLKGLKDAGDLSEDEYKQLLLDLLKK